MNGWYGGWAAWYTGLGLVPGRHGADAEHSQVTGRQVPCQFWLGCWLADLTLEKTGVIPFFQGLGG